ncbi:MAG TPA: Mur ligase family protein [Acidimicrobiales bacterium]|nr:Mur ligase family protein [Acidimicrobiales bacterium]
MSVLAAVALAAGLAATGLASVRWLRVAQREHYLAGAVTRFASRWWRCDAAHAVALLAALAGASAAVVTPGAGLVSAVVAASGPRGLTLRGRTGKLVWTARLRRLAAVLALLVSAAVGGAGAVAGLGGSAAAAALSAILTPTLLDAALAIVAPYEARVLRRFVSSARRRLELVRPTIVGITGSYGKTTTKGYVAHLLAGRYTVVRSPRSFNNQAGLARTVNELLVPGTDVLVAEMGAYGPGEIAALCEWLPPKVAVITAIGPVHLERFKSLRRTLAAKAEITTRADTVVVNVDDDLLAELARQLEGEGRRVLRCSARDEQADVCVLVTGPSWSVRVAGCQCAEVAFPGDREPGSATNVACAVGVALALGVPLQEIAQRLPNLPVAESRLQVAGGGEGPVVLDDTFNANPAGAALALRRLTEIGRRLGGRMVVVTPGMVELGPIQARENAAFARSAAAVATDLVIVGATNRRALLAGARSAQAGRGERADGPSAAPAIVTVPNREAAVAWVRAALTAGDVVLYENDLPDHYP